MKKWKGIVFLALLITLATSSTVLAESACVGGWSEFDVLQVLAGEDGIIGIDGMENGEEIHFYVSKTHPNKKEIYSLSLLAASLGKKIKINCTTTSNPTYYNVVHALLHF